MFIEKGRIMKKSKILLYLMIAIAITLCVPSMIYLFNNKTINGFQEYYTFTLQPFKNMEEGLKGGLIFICLLMLFSILYLLIVKKENKIFKDKKKALFFIMIISFIFMLILPFLSSDVYYYIGEGWLEAKYKQNPYYTTVLDLQRQRNKWWDFK